MRKKKLLKTLPKVAQHFLQNKPINSVTEIKITRLCNQRCRQCNIHEDLTGNPYMSLSEYMLVLRRLKKYGSLVGMISGGEPLLHPDIIEILKHAQKTFPLSVSLVTGLYFDYEKISDVIDFCLKNGINIQTSLDGLEETGSYLRGVENHPAIILSNMKKITERKKEFNSSSFTYVNCVLSAKNLHQVPEIIEASKDAGWEVTVGVYHSLLDTTKEDDEMKITDAEALHNTIDFLTDNPSILNLNSFIEGIPRILDNDFPDFCPFVDGKRTATRLTIMHNGEVHLCKGDAVGNLLDQDLENIMENDQYRRTLEEYSTCDGCWSSCYTQKYLLFHPQNFSQVLAHGRKLFNLKGAAKER
ncbi:MAG: radical SAM protein [Candidatus Cloacimonetes bacterium]|nr:radical SAM protein [Candidatus Cloacimonadota bacterium]